MGRKHAAAGIGWEAIWDEDRQAGDERRYTLNRTQCPYKNRATTIEVFIIHGTQ